MSVRGHSFPSVITLCLAVFLSLIIRCFSYGNFINPEGGFYFYSVDAYDHLRRITLGIQSFPQVASFDNYAAFPIGLGQIWAPLFDYFLAGLFSVVGANRQMLETICFFFNPMVACSTVLLIFIIARKSFSSVSAGLFSAILLALYPGYISYSIPMNFDHHAMEPIIVLLLFALPFFEKKGDLTFFRKMAVALALVFVIFLWRGSSLFWGVSFVSVLLRAISTGNRSLTKSYSCAYLLAGFLVSCYCLADPWGLARQVSFGVVSWFHVIALSGMAVVLWLYGTSKSNKAFYNVLLLLVAVVGLGLLLPPFNHLLKEMAGGLTFISGKGDPWLEINSELNPVFSSSRSFWFSASYLTIFWFLMPVAILLAWRNLWRPEKKIYLINFVVWSPLFLMGLVIRYTHVSGVIVCLGAAFFFSWLWRGCWIQWQKIAVVVLFGALLMPGLPHYRNTLVSHLPEHMKHGLYGRDGVLDWLKNNTTPTAGYLDPSTPPEYGVLARWSMGARIYQLAERPAMSTAFGWEAHGFYQEAGFWVTKNSAKAWKIIDENAIRYVVVQAVHDLKSDYRVALQGETEGALEKGTVGEELLPGFTIYNRLLNGDGGAFLYNGQMITALQNYRLVFESDYLARTADQKGGDLSFYKVFEAVPGALVQAKVEAGVPVTVRLKLQTSRQRSMLYFDRVIADSTGLISFRLPYATDTKQGGTMPLGSYQLQVAGKRPIALEVTNSQVEKGEILTVGTL